MELKPKERIRSFLIKTARRIMRRSFAKYPNFRYVYQCNIAMLLHDHHGITDYKKRNSAASDIIKLVFDSPQNDNQGEEHNDG